MKKNIVILAGSPCKVSATDKLTAAFSAGAEEAGHTVATFRVADLKISGCLGCGHCLQETGVCVQKDDMGIILNALRKADTLVLASPLYFWNFTAQLKCAIDRTYALLKEGSTIKQAILLVTYGADPNIFENAVEPCIATFRQICVYPNWQEAGIVAAPNVHSPQDMEGRPELEQAKQLGRNFK
jgi:multimeric flavodoxin WrbA